MPRDNSQAGEDSGSGMKVAAITLAVLLAGTGYFFFQSRQAASQQADADSKSIASLSNQVNELRTRLAMETAMHGLALSNQQYTVTRRTIELIGTSNRLVQTALLLSNAQHEANAAEARLPANAATIATLEAHRDQLLRELEVVPALQREIAELKRRGQDAQLAHAALQETVGRLQADKANFERLLNDPVFLRLQASRAEDAAELRRRASGGRTPDARDPRVRLELQPDGSVRPASVGASAASK